MILLFNPRAASARSRRFPLSILALAAVLEGREEYAIVDGNVDPDPTDTICRLIELHDPELLGVTVMPGPQMAAAVESCREIRERHPEVPIVWGGYFPSIYTDTALNAAYVDFAVRGQGEDTLLELLEALRGQRAFEEVRGLSYKDPDGAHRHNPERMMKGPDSFPWMPFHRLDVENYTQGSFFGKRTAAYQASVGCPFQCTFCGISAAFGSREKMESPARTEAVLRHLRERYGIDSVVFLDMNFFLRETHARELADRLAPLGLRWWCEARIDVVGGYSDETLAAIRRAGCTMIFFGAESGSDWVLKEMKQITTAQTLELASRIRKFDIIPEFSFVVGNPKDPDADTKSTLDFIRKIKRLNRQAEIIIYHYTPVPQRDKKMYGEVDDTFEFPTTPEEWATERWLNFTLRIDPATPWLKRKTRKLIDNFEIVVAARWPTVLDIRVPRWSRRMLQALSAWRYQFKIYAFPQELKLAQQWIELRKPKRESA